MAAKEVLKKLEEQLNCPICLDTYIDPKLLLCHHVYCKECLDKLVIRDQQGVLILTCSHCRQVTPVPPRGVAGLQSAFHINHLLDIQQSLQKLPVAPVSVEGAVGGECSSLNAERKASYCSEHRKKELELYCETLICSHCAIKEGKHASNSFGQLALKPLTTKKLPIQVLEGFSQPWGVVINQKGNIIVSDAQKDCIFMLSHAGEHLRSFGTPGSGPGQFNTPYGVAVDAEDNILVVDSENHRLQKFNSEGEFLTTLGAQGDKPLQFLEPKDIVFSPINKKLYVVDDNCRIQVLNSDLTFFAAFGSRGNGEGQFDYPCGITCDGNGDIYVVDSGNNRIQVFTAEGIFIRQFGSHGDRDGELNVPIGIAVNNGLAYISEYDNHRVSMFTCNGEFVVSFGQYGRDRGQFFFPGNLTVQNNSLYVCGRLNRRLQVFSV